MRRAFMWSVSAIAFTWMTSAQADPPKLKGDYAFTGSAVCIFAPGSSPTSTNPTPGVALPNSGFFTDTVVGPGGHRPFQPKEVGHVFSSSHSAEGIRTFNGDGTGTLRGTVVYVSPPPGPG